MQSKQNSPLSSSQVLGSLYRLAKTSAPKGYEFCSQLVSKLLCDPRAGNHSVPDFAHLPSGGTIKAILVSHKGQRGPMLSPNPVPV